MSSDAYTSAGSNVVRLRTEMRIKFADVRGDLKILRLMMGLAVAGVSILILKADFV